MKKTRNIPKDFKNDWQDHWTNGGTGVTKTSGHLTAAIAESVEAFRDSQIYMKGTELHMSRERLDLSDFWRLHESRLANKKYTVQRWSQYKLGGGFHHDKYSDAKFDDFKKAEDYALSADSGISGDTRYRYKIIDETGEKVFK